MRKEKLVVIYAILMIILSIFPISDVNGQTFSVEPVAHLKVGDFAHNCPIDISEDGSTLAVAMKDDSSNIVVTIINISRFEILGSIETDINYLGGMDLSLNPNGTIVAIVAFFYFQMFTIPECELEQDLSEYFFQDIWPEDIAWSPDGNLIAVGPNEIGNSYRVAIINASDWTIDTELTTGSPNVSAITWSQDGTMLASAGDGTTSGNRSIDVWDTTDWTNIFSQPIDIDIINDMTFNPNSSLLVAAGYEGPIQVWNTIDWSQQSFGGAHSDVTRSTSFSRDGVLLMTDSVLWTVDDLKQWGEFEIATHGLFSPSHDDVVTATIDGDLYKWDSSTWSAAAASGDKPNFKEPNPLATLCMTLMVIAIVVIITIVILAVITALMIKRKVKRDNNF